MCSTLKTPCHGPILAVATQCGRPHTRAVRTHEQSAVADVSHIRFARGMHKISGGWHKPKPGEAERLC